MFKDTLCWNLKRIQTISNMMYQEKSAYKEPAYKELPLIKNWFSFQSQYLQGTSSLYVYNEPRLKGTYFHGPDEFLITGFYCMYICPCSLNLMFLLKYYLLISVEFVVLTYMLCYLVMNNSAT